MGAACCCGQEEREGRGRVIALLKFGGVAVKEIDIWHNLLFSQRRHGTADVSDDEEDDGEDGTFWFQERKLQPDEGISAELLAEVRKLSVTVTPIGNDGRNWKLHGIHVEKFLNLGFFRLDRLLGQEGIHILPVNDAGKPKLLHDSLFRDLLKGNRVLKLVPAADVAAAQNDLHGLSLRQLVHLKALNIDFAPCGNSIHAIFVWVLNMLIFEQLGQKAANQDVVPWANHLPWAKRLGRDIVLIVAAAKLLDTPQVWAMWFAEERLFFHMVRLACTNATGFAFGEGGVLEFVERSEPDRMAGDGPLVLNLTVKHVTREFELSERPADATSSVGQLSFSQADVRA